MRRLRSCAGGGRSEVWRRVPKEPVEVVVRKLRGCCRDGGWEVGDKVPERRFWSKLNLAGGVRINGVLGRQSVFAELPVGGLG